MTFDSRSFGRSHMPDGEMGFPKVMLLGTWIGYGATAFPTVSSSIVLTSGHLTNMLQEKPDMYSADDKNSLIQVVDVIFTEVLPEMKQSVDYQISLEQSNCIDPAEWIPPPEYITGVLGRRANDMQRRQSSTSQSGVHRSYSPAPRPVTSGTPRPSSPSVNQSISHISQ